MKEILHDAMYLSDFGFFVKHPIFCVCEAVIVTVIGVVVWEIIEKRKKK